MYKEIIFKHSSIPFKISKALAGILYPILRTAFYEGYETAREASEERLRKDHLQKVVKVTRSV